MKVQPSRPDATPSASAAAKTRPQATIDGAEDRDGPKSQPLVMIRCAICETAACASLNSAQNRALLGGGMIRRHCSRCRRKTLWKNLPRL